MSARRVHDALAVVAFLLCLVSVSYAQESKARIVRLSFLDGQVQIDRNSGQGWERAILNMPIVQGTKISAQQGSHAEVEFEDGSTARLVGPAQISFPELNLSSGKKRSTVRVESGLVYFDVPKLKDDSFGIVFGEHNFAVHKNARFRVNVSDPDENVAVMKGELELLGGDKEVAVKKGETISFTADQSQYAMAKDIDKLGADDWNKDREQDRQLLARSDQYRLANSYYGGYNYGLYDLARYGNWYYGPGYGWLWRPYFYDASYAYDPYAWDPFGFGSWSYYPGAGWTFISGYPWGWTPYRYGSWMFVPGYGWSWRPGPPSYGWQTAPVVVSPPAGYGLPRPPMKTSGPTVAVTGIPRPTTGVSTPTTSVVPRPGAAMQGRDVVPTRPVVMPGALNAGKLGRTREIGPMNSPQIRGGRVISPDDRSAPGVQPRKGSNPEAPASAPKTNPAPINRPTPRMEPSAPRTSPPPSMAPPRMSPPPSMAPAPMPRPSGGGGKTPH